MNLVVEKQSPLAAAELVSCEVIKAADFGCVWHHHPECEITLVLQGGTERWVGDKLTRLRAGDLVLLGSDLPHDYRNDRAGRTKPVHAIVVQFLPTLFGEKWLGHGTTATIRRLFERARLGLEIRGATRRRATLLLHEISRSRGLHRIVLFMTLLECLAGSADLHEIASPGFQAGTNSRTSDRIGAAVTHIERNLAKPLYVPELASLTGLSESAFSRLFRKCTGRSVPQYLNELRIARASRLLAETDQSVKQIAHACGYPTPAYFHRQFHRHQKLSPLGYRAAVRRPS